MVVVAFSHVAPHGIPRGHAQVCGLQKANGDFNGGQKVDLNAKIDNHNGQLVWG